MSLVELHVELTNKQYELQDHLFELQHEMDLVEKNIEVHEQDPTITVDQIQPLYQRLWSLQSDFDESKQELEKIKKRLNELVDIVGGIMDITI